MKNFIKNFISSLKNASFYKEKANEEHITGYSYLVKLAFVTGLVIYLIMVFGLYFSGTLGKIKTEINAKIKDDVSVYIDKNGELSINQPTPYIIPISDFFEEENGNNKGEDDEIIHANFIVIDTTREANATVFSAYDTMVFISKDRIMMERSNGEIRSYPLKDWSDTTINKQTINHLLVKIYNFAWILMLFMIIPFWFISFFTYLFIAFFASLVLYFLVKKFYKKMSFKHTMNVAMYGYTYAFLLGIIFSVVSFSLFSGYFWTKVLITIIVTIYFLSKKEDQLQSEQNTLSGESIAVNTTNVV